MLTILSCEKLKAYLAAQYARLEDARAAQQNLNGVLELAGRPIKVIDVESLNPTLFPFCFVNFEFYVLSALFLFR